MERTHDENRCATCAKRTDKRHAVKDTITGTFACFAAGVEDGDLVCRNWTPEEGQA